MSSASATDSAGLKLPAALTPEDSAQQSLAEFGPDEPKLIPRRSVNTFGVTALQQLLVRLRILYHHL